MSKVTLQQVGDALHMLSSIFHNEAHVSDIGTCTDSISSKHAYNTRKAWNKHIKVSFKKAVSAVLFKVWEDEEREMGNDAD